MQRLGSWLALGTAAAMMLLTGGAAADEQARALEELLEEAEHELDTSELDAAALEDWAEDELAERRTLCRLKRRAAALQRRATVRGWLPRLSFDLRLDLPGDRAAGRGGTAAAASEGSRPGPDDADGAARVGLRWQVTLRLVWKLPGVSI